MVRYTHITSSVSFLEDHRRQLVWVSINQYLLKLSTEAAEVLIGYLKIIKAYYSPFKQFQALTNQFYEEIGTQLNGYVSVIGLREISALISVLGCISDWERRGFKAAVTFFRLQNK
ncbi:hypothetical protein [Pedobacter heparinus]|uniref:hypothetical protein n=1 Tax=Pedobacter heparinus TaxID=984 RepID=UPI0029317613|nr:hypothetical protein [Pedobacter heparinus]